MAKAKTKVSAKKKSVVKTTTPKEEIKKEEVVVEDSTIEEKVEEVVVENSNTSEEITKVIIHRNVETVIKMAKDFISENVKPGNLISSTRIYDPNREQRVATIVYKK